MKRSYKYIPALSRDWLTPLFDPLLRFVVPEVRLKTDLIGLANFEPNQLVLDLGCGTGTLIILIAQRHLNLKVWGIDADPQILELARKKIAVSDVGITLDQGMAQELPYPDGFFDRIVSSLMLHHLRRNEKFQALSECFRVLKSNGTISILDFTRPVGMYGHAVSLLIRHLEETIDNIAGLMPQILRDTGFHNITEVKHYQTVFGTWGLLSATKQ